MTKTRFEDLKDQIGEIIAICKDVPEEFRSRCFEMLMEALLKPPVRETERKKEDRNHLREKQEDESPKDKTEEDNDDKKTASISGHVKAFLRRQDLEESLIKKLVMIDGEELHWLKEPAHNNVRKGQNEWALLLGLKSALMGKSTLAVDPEDVRSAAQDKGFYDKKNFATNFKVDPYQSWYKGEMIPQGTPQTLSKDGEVALADLIKSLTNG